MNRDELIERFKRRDEAQQLADDLNGPIWAACDVALHGWHGADSYGNKQRISIESTELHRLTNEVGIAYRHYEDIEYIRFPIAIIASDTPHDEAQQHRARHEEAKEAERKAKEIERERAEAQRLLDKYPDLVQKS